MAKADRRWLRQTEPPLCVSWEAWSTEKGRKDNELAFLSIQYPSRILCPDSGATSKMCPDRNMFIEYDDVQAERRYVRLGDENQRILIHGRGTMCLLTQALPTSPRCRPSSCLLETTGVQHLAAVLWQIIPAASLLILNYS
jgi:hypothetical protein